ncbi:hypothetical protein FPV67DRAFT_1530952 [Lyophyllum atratum]|nr:hypothetical protein FPV67DRAFT_1530952 [Lyophyllum atratum]
MDMRDYAWGTPFVMHGMEDLPELAASSPLNLPQPLADAIRAAVRAGTWRRRASGYASALGNARVAAARMRLGALGARVPIEWGTALRAVMGLRVVDVPLRVSAPTADVAEEEEDEEETHKEEDESNGSRTVSVEDLGEADPGPSEDEEEDSTSDPLLPPPDASIACTSSASFTTALSLSFISSPHPIPPSPSHAPDHDAFSFRPDASSSHIHPHMVFAPDEDGVWLPREVRAGEEMDMDSRGWLGMVATNNQDQDQNQRDLRVSEEEWAEFIAMFPEVLTQAPVNDGGGGGGGDEMSEYLPPLDGGDEVGEGLSWDDEGVRGGEEVEAGLATFISGADADHTEEDVHEIPWNTDDIRDGDAIEAGLEDYSLIIDDTPLGRPIPFIIDESTPDTPDADQESEEDMSGAILAGPYLGELARMMEEEMRAVEEVQMRGAMRERVEETGRQWASFTSRGRGGGRGALKGKGKGRVEPGVDRVRGVLPKVSFFSFLFPLDVLLIVCGVCVASCFWSQQVSDAATTEITTQGKGKGKERVKKPEVDRVRGALPKVCFFLLLNFILLMVCIQRCIASCF